MPLPIPPLVTRWAIIAAVGTALFAFGWLQGAHREQIKAQRFEAATEALGKAQAARAAETNRRQRATLERANHDLHLANRAAAENAVRNYLDRGRLTGWLRDDSASGSPLPGPAAREPGNDAAGRECLAACQPPDEFIAACARDAGRLDVWRGWAVANQVPVE